ncbi:uncharacterized protein SCHCODRAFT_02520237 [Schizophyllum commune H4-8]|nr:uncharacterized protein SCHCODRAFT_02520237 [Schizophyllum commune H4-8]KAI5885712.1 hypothetical protein SCHCODRAFT_02520237 [Schizophyllum commune H4-8]
MFLPPFPLPVHPLCHGILLALLGPSASAHSVATIPALYSRAAVPGLYLLSAVSGSYLLSLVPGSYSRPTGKEGGVWGCGGKRARRGRTWTKMRGRKEGWGRKWWGEGGRGRAKAVWRRVRGGAKREAVGGANGLEEERVRGKGREEGETGEPISGSQSK